MSVSHDPLEYLLTGVGFDRKIKYLTSNELDEIRAVLNDCTCRTNIIYCENSKEPPILSRVYKDGVELSTDRPEYEKERPILSASPAQDSINILCWKNVLSRTQLYSPYV